MTCDIWNVTGAVVNIVSIFQVPSSNGLGVMVFWRFGGKGSLTDWINDGGVWRTAPAILGLVKMSLFASQPTVNSGWVNGKTGDTQLLTHDMTYDIYIFKYIRLCRGSLHHTQICALLDRFYRREQYSPVGPVTSLSNASPVFIKPSQEGLIIFTILIFTLIIITKGWHTIIIEFPFFTFNNIIGDLYDDINIIGDLYDDIMKKKN